MAINWTEAQIEQVVASVLKGLKGEASTKAPGNFSAESYEGRRFVGVFADMNDAIEAASAGYKAVRAMSLEERERRLIELRYFEGLTQVKTAKELGMSQVQVSRKEKAILMKMRKMM